MDVESFELKVLQGAENTIRKHKPIMYIEIHDAEAYTFMENLDLGYRIFYSNSMNRLFKSNTAVEELQELLKIQK